jgi:hypothetical protein
MHTIPIDSNWKEKARDFATRTVMSRMSKLRSRGQRNIEKITKDVMAGTIAEFGVREMLLHTGDYTDISLPDLELYVGKQKSFKADLVGLSKTTGTQHIHVKSYSNPLWSSWVFTYNPDRGDVDPLIEQPSEQDYLALTYVNFVDNVVELKAFIRAGKVINLYKPPILPQLKFSKLVLYSEDLKSLSLTLA